MQQQRMKRLIVTQIRRFSHTKTKCISNGFDDSEDYVLFQVKVWTNSGNRDYMVC